MTQPFERHPGARTDDASTRSVAWIAASAPRRVAPYARQGRARHWCRAGGMALATIVASLGLALAGCAGGAAPRLHSLLASGPTAPAGAPVQPSGRLAVVLEPVRVPSAVNQPQWLVRMADDSLASLESERWASPLADELRQAIFSTLGSRFGVIDAREDRLGGGPVWRVRVDVRRLESIPGREARIEGAWTIVGARPARLRSSTSDGSATAVAPVLQCDWVFQEPVGAGMLALAAGHRRAVERLAEAIGTQLQHVERGEPAGCAASG